MKGARPLANSEILLVAKQFDGTFAIRNRSLFMLGVSVGGRISEMLALTIGDVWQNGRPVLDLLFLRGIVKGKDASRMIPVNADGQQAILDLVTWHGQKFGDLVPDRALFPSSPFLFIAFVLLWQRAGYPIEKALTVRHKGKRKTLWGRIKSRVH